MTTALQISTIIAICFGVLVWNQPRALFQLADWLERLMLRTLHYMRRQAHSKQAAQRAYRAAREAYPAGLIQGTR